MIGHLVQESDLCVTYCSAFSLLLSRLPPKGYCTDVWFDLSMNWMKDFYHVSLGAARENPVTLTAIDWADVYCDNVVNCVRPGQKQNGVWHVQIEQSGDYEIALRRWPKEADAALTAGVPATSFENRSWPAGVALPIAKARLKLAATDETKTVSANDKEAVFRVTLKAGAQLSMQSWFYDANGNELCGAYYAYVRRK